ncbi:MAG TPA: JDVT-CTERM system glutamic-type intramembrane protease [Gammaproteobacteria bacterium]|nr:JDVT-CTERM system glutamic-type intramembrane protease [Gammaproteobacteria bacterium]
MTAGAPGPSAGAAFWRDPRFGLALAAALPVWLAFTLVQPPERALLGLWQDPGRLLYLAVALPILEETAFRGLVQEGLGRLIRRRWGPLSAANLGTSAVFALLHLPVHPPLWAASVAAPSLVFGYFKDRHGGLGAPVALHVFYNAGFFLLYPP